jgi:hypothetical protein
MPKARFKTCTFEKCRKHWFRGSLCEEHFKAARGASTDAASAPAAAPAASA